MSVQLIATAKRPSIDVPWHDGPDGKGWHLRDEHYLEFWHEKGRLLSSSLIPSEDGLTLTQIREFIDWQALDDFISDENLIPARTAMNEYMAELGIEVIDIETKEV